MAAGRPLRAGQVLWTPSADDRERSELARYLHWLRRERGLDLADYDALWRWSVTDLEGFWSSIWAYFAVRAHTPYERVLGSREMPGAEWFPGATLNYAEHMLGRAEDTDAVAVVAHSQSRDPFELTFGELRGQVARARAGLQRLGIGPGDRVVAYLPNIPETLVAFLAAASLGAIWAPCPPEFGVRSVVDRLGQLEPKLLLAVAGYRYGEKLVDRREQAAQIRERLPSLETVVHVPYAGGGGDVLPDASSWDELARREGAARVRPAALRAPALRPLLVGHDRAAEGDRPRPRRHPRRAPEEPRAELGPAPGDRLQWFTTTAWMMWNALVSALLLRASIVMIDGNPAYPDLSFQWQLVERTRATMLGVSPAFAFACRKQGVEPGRLFDLSSLRSVGVAGSPLPAEGFEWLYEQLDPDVLPHQRQRRHRRLHRHRPGLPAPAGVRGRDRRPLPRPSTPRRSTLTATRSSGELGELVIRQPMPSMAGPSGTTPASSATAPRTSTSTRASGGTATGSCSPSAGAA